MFVIVAILFLQAGIALWWAAPGMEDTAIAVYHSIAGVCRHTFRPNASEAVTVAALVVVAAFCLVLARGVRSTCRQLRQTRRTVGAMPTIAPDQWPETLRTAAARVGVAGCLRVVESPAAYAFTYGLRRPRICVSIAMARLLTLAEIEAVLLHEHHHRAQRDPLLVLMSRALADACSFIPLLPALQERYEALKELAADAAAVRRVGTAAMAGALYKALVNDPTAIGTDALGAAAGLSVTQRRIDHLLDPSPNDIPPLNRRTLTYSGLLLALTSVPLLALSAVAASIQPMAHICRL